MTYTKDSERIASSDLRMELLGDISDFSRMLAVEKDRLKSKFPDPAILDSMFDNMQSRVINICPMAVANALAADLGLPYDENLLKGIGLAMYSISTHDDVVDEMPSDRLVVAGLVYAGNIATLEGISILQTNGLGHVVPRLIEMVNLNHYYQTKIADSIWKTMPDEQQYLDAIGHTKYWIAAGLYPVLAAAKREDLSDFADIFAECYGTTCQLYDDMREIDDDIANGYYSLPISVAHSQGLDLSVKEDRIKAIQPSASLAKSYLSRARVLCEADFPHLLKLVERMENIGQRLFGSDDKE